MTSPWLTVVTVVKDDHDGLARTVASLARGDLEGVEHVVVDSSADPVSQIAMEPTDARIVRQEPRGVYAAMNAGLAAATGRLAWFLNAGDEVAEPGVVARLRHHTKEATWAHGPVIVTSRSGTRTQTPRWEYARERRRLFARGRFPAHQGTVASVAALRSLGGFDTTYRICADYKAALGLSLIAEPVELRFPVAMFAEGGVSTTEWRASVAEFHRARRESLAPRGKAAVIELADTARQAVALGLYRSIVEPRRS